MIILTQIEEVSIASFSSDPWRISASAHWLKLNPLVNEKRLQVPKLLLIQKVRNGHVLTQNKKCLLIPYIIFFRDLQEYLVYISKAAYENTFQLRY